MWGLERAETLKSLVSNWEGWRRAEIPFDPTETKVLLPSPSQLEEHIVEVSTSIGGTVQFCGITNQQPINQPINQGINQQPIKQDKSFMFQGGGQMAAVTLGWRQTNCTLPVLTGISVHWDTGPTDTVGQVG